MSGKTLLNNKVKETVAKTVTDPTAYYVINDNGEYERTTVEDFDYDETTQTYSFKSGVIYYEKGAEGEEGYTEVDNPEKGRDTVGGKPCYNKRNM